MILTLRDIMTREVETLSPELSLRDAMEFLATRHISGAPVVSGQKVVGVVSTSDLLLFAASLAGVRVEQEELDEWQDPEEMSSDFEDLDKSNAAYFSDLWSDRATELSGQLERISGPEWTALDEHTVAEAMSRDVRSLSPLTDVTTTAGFMKRVGIHRVLVMTDGKLEGIVSAMDIVEAVAQRRVPAPSYRPARELDFDAGWSHEPVVPEA